MDCASTEQLVSGHLLSSDSGIDSVVMGDIADSLLFSQLSADLKFNRFDAPVSWFSRHDDAMQHVKWLLTGNLREAFEPEAEASITVMALIERLLLSRLSDARAEAVRHMVDCMGGLTETDKASLLFRQQVLRVSTEAKVHSSVVLQVSALVRQTQLFSFLVSFATNHVVGPDPFRQVFPGSSIVGEVDARFVQHDWNHASYQTVREKVRKVLAEKRCGLILPIPCAPVDGENNDG